MAATAVEAWDERWATSEGRADWLVPHPAVAALVPVLKARGVQHVLDLGCGVGRHALLFAEHGFAVEAIDGAAAGLDFARREGGRARPPTEPTPGRCRRAAFRRRELRLCVVVERHLSRYNGRCRPPPRRDLARPEVRWALSGYDAVEAGCAIRPRPASRPRHLHPWQRRHGAPALLLRLGWSRRTLRRLRASLAHPGGAAPPWLVALAHPRRTAVNGNGRYRRRRGGQWLEIAYRRELLERTYPELHARFESSHSQCGRDGGHSLSRRSVDMDGDCRIGGSGTTRN